MDNKKIKEEMAYRFNFCLMKRNMKKNRLAELTGITPQTINNYAKAKNIPKLETVLDIAKALEVFPDYLLCKVDYWDLNEMIEINKDNYESKQLGLYFLFHSLGYECFFDIDDKSDYIVNYDYSIEYKKDNLSLDNFGGSFPYFKVKCPNNEIKYISALDLDKLVKIFSGAFDSFLISPTYFNNLKDKE